MNSEIDDLNLEDLIEDLNLDDDSPPKPPPASKTISEEKIPSPADGIVAEDPVVEEEKPEPKSKAKAKGKAKSESKAKAKAKARVKSKTRAPRVRRDAPKGIDTSQGSYDIGMVNNAMDRIYGELPTDTSLPRAWNKRKGTVVLSGPKGVGKSLCALAFPGIRACIDLEGTALEMYNEEDDPFLTDDAKENIFIMDARTSLVPKTEEEAKPVGMTVKMLIDKFLDILEANPQKPDWIIFDGAGRWSRHLEQAMRSVYGHGAFSGFKERNHWKLRNLFAASHFDRARDIARCGVIFCSHYTTKTETKKNAETGMDEEITVKEPNWVQSVKEESDVVVHLSNAERSMGVGQPSVHAFIGSIPTNKITGQTSGHIVYTNNPRKIYEFIAKGKKPFTISS